MYPPPPPWGRVLTKIGPRVSYANPLQHFCPCTILQAKRAPSIQPKFEGEQLLALALKFLPCVPWNLGRKD